MAINYSQTTSRDSVLIVAGLFGLLGLGALVLGSKGGGTSTPGHGGGGTTNSPCQNQGAPAALGNPSAADQPSANAQVHVQRGQYVTLNTLTIPYANQTEAIDVYTYAQITQNGVTVYGSGVAGVAVGPIAQPDPCQWDEGTYNQNLVSPCQPQAGGGVGNYLVLFPWGSPLVTPPICGGNAVPGPADLEIIVYGNEAETGNPADGPIPGGSPATAGFGSPTCTTRTCVRKTVVPNAYYFV